MHITPNKFGRDISQSVIGSMMAVSYLGIMLMPPFFLLTGSLIMLFAYHALGKAEE